MIGRLLDVVKWTLIFVIAGIIFYLVGPKYDYGSEIKWTRFNKVTGEVSVFDMENEKWVKIMTPDSPLRPLSVYITYLKNQWDFLKGGD